MPWWSDNGNDPTLGSVNGEHDVWFKTNDAGETLISDASNDPSRFNSSGQHGTDTYQRGQHNHYGNGNGNNDNAADRGWYSGPGH